MKTILHATDFSAHAVPALRLAHAMSKASGSSLIVLHVFDIPTIVSSPRKSGTFAVIEKDVQQLHTVRLETFCREQLGEPASKGVRFMVKESGTPAKAIMQIADEVDADMVLVGTRGESRLRELLMGSTAKRLLKECQRPVLVVPADARTKAPERIAQAVLTEEVDVAAVLQGLRTADALGATLVVVHVASVNDKAAHERLSELIARVKERTGRKQIQHKVVHVREITVAEGLDQYLLNHPADLLMMLERRQHNVLDMLFGSDMIAGMAFHTKVPTLVLREERRSL